MANALIIEDNELTGNLLERTLAGAQHHVCRANTGKAGLDLVEGNNIDIAIVDLRLPDITGLQVCESIRERGLDMPVLILTGYDTVPQRVTCLNAGADDFLGKPFHVDEVIARVDSLLRRSKRTRAGAGEDSIPLELNARKSVLVANGRQIALTAREIQILRSLACVDGDVVSVAMLFGANSSGRDFTNLAQVLIHNLRKKLDENGVNDLIVTVRGRGYRLGQAVRVAV